MSDSLQLHDHSMPGILGHHQLLEFTQTLPESCRGRYTAKFTLWGHHLPEITQTHVHRVRDAIQPSHPLSSPSPPAPNPSQHQSLFQWVNSSHKVAKVLGTVVVDIMVIWIKFTHSIHFSSLIPKMSVFTLAISCLTTSNLPWFVDLTFQGPMQYCSLQHRTLLRSPVTSTTGCCFCFRFCLFILSGVISPMISSSMLGTY